MYTFKDTTLNKFQAGSYHRLVRARLFLDLKLERVKLVSKAIASRINIDNLTENSEQYQKTVSERIDGSQLMKVIVLNKVDNAKEIGEIQQLNEHNKLSAETKALFKRRKEMKCNTNSQSIEFRELCKMQILENITKF